MSEFYRFKNQKLKDMMLYAYEQAIFIRNDRTSRYKVIYFKSKIKEKK